MADPMLLPPRPNRHDLREASVSNSDEGREDTDPYCNNCGYSLIGLTESSRCPECGEPIVEVLVRDRFPGRGGLRYQSNRRLFGWPLVAIAWGPRGTERYGRPKGIIAIGEKPRGVIALGGQAVGALAVGGFACGGIAFGGFALGIHSLGGFSTGIVALGGFAVGLFAFGGMIIPLIKGVGGWAFHLWPW